MAHKGSGGNNYESNPELKRYALPDTAHFATGQLFDLDRDPGETQNMALEHPEIVKQLERLLRQSIESGRSRPIESN